MTTNEEEDEPQNIWTALARSITEVAENTIGRKRKKPKKDRWISEETIFLIEKKRKLKPCKITPEDLYRKPDSDNSMEPVVVSEEEREPGILLDEVKNAILLQKNNKAPREDQIQAELIKEAGDLGAQVMHKLCNTI